MAALHRTVRGALELSPRSLASVEMYFVVAERGVEVAVGNTLPVRRSKDIRHMNGESAETDEGRDILSAGQEEQVQGMR